MAKRLLTRVTLLGFGIVMALAVLEGGLRLWIGTRGSESERVMYIYDRATIDAQTAQMIGIPYLNYTLNPNREGVNQRGIPGEMAQVPKPEGIYRIVALGGSTTFGHGLSVQEAWPAQLQLILRDKYGYKNVEVINLGVPGFYSLDSVVSLATRGLAHEPDLVIGYDSLNDAMIRLYQDPACYNGDSPLFGFGMDRGIWQVGGDDLPPSALYRFLAIRLGWMDAPTTVDSRMALTGWCPPEPGNVSQLDLLAQNPATHFERNERSIAALAQSGGAQMLFSSFAWDTAAARAALAEDAQLYALQALLDAIDEQNNLLRAIADDMGASFVDITTEMTSSTYFQGDHVHQTAEGARRQAEIYAAFLDAQKRIPR
jgi:lysophospholipase L1-like esterase